MPLHVLIIAIAGAATAGLVAVLALPLGTAAWVVLGLTGIFFAGMFATNLAYAGNTYPEHSGTAFSLIMAAGACGALIGPWLMGVVAELSTIRLAFWLIAAAMFANILIFLRLGPATVDHLASRAETQSAA
jgi:FHS family glucose/mannose:H+ symporter-like MFS transporter